MERTDLRTSQPGLWESPAPERPGSGTPSTLSLCLEAAPGGAQPRRGHVARSPGEVLSMGRSEWHVPVAATCQG